MVCCTNHSQLPFVVQIISNVPCLDVGGRPTQCFPFYVYDEDGSNRRENITDWALAQFRAHYGDEGITKWDIFYYVYALLHHPTYRSKYADNLKRELPRIPLNLTPPAPAASLTHDGESTEARQSGHREGEQRRAFWAFAEAGKRLADLHLNYETVEPYALEYMWKAGKPATYRVEKMRLTPLPNPLPASGEREQTRALVVNEALTLKGIPAEAFEYRLGNRSALDWVIDQYQVKEDKRSHIKSDPNAYSEDEQYIVKLVGRVVQVSVETVAIVKGLPNLTPNPSQG